MRVGSGHSGQERQPEQRGRASGKQKGLCIGSLAPEQDGAGEWGASSQTLQKVEGQGRPVRGLRPSNLAFGTKDQEFKVIINYIVSSRPA